MLRHISKEVFHRNYEGTFNHVFRKLSVMPDAFADPKWGATFLPYGFNLESAAFSAFCDAVLELDRTAIVADIETLPPFSHSAAIDLAPEDWESARCDMVLGHVDVAVFGESGAWGMLISVEDYAVVGGVGTFMGKLLDGLGGESEARKRFIEFANEEWAADINFRNEVLRTLLEAV